MIVANRRVIVLIFTAMCVLALGSLLVVRVVYAAGTTLTVNWISGDGSDQNPGDGICDVSVNVGEQCTLRAAIEELNALGADTTPHRIEFNISGTGPFTIAPNSELPAITVPVVVDGETQPGASCPTSSDPANLLIVLDGSNAGTGGQIAGLTLNPGSEGSTIRGLVIGNFDDAGIRIGSDGNIVRCNHLGVGVDGLSSMSNSIGVFVGKSDNVVGGQVGPAQRNVISANSTAGIYIFAGSNSRVRGNFIGTTADGLGDLGNSGGIYVGGNNNVIGGTNLLAGNVISGNGFGIRVNSGEANVIQGNYIGVGKDGVTPLPQSSDGIQLTGAAIANVVGGTAVGEANVIAHANINGVVLTSNIAGFPVQNEIRGNAIYANGGLGIDIGNYDGVDTNDPGDGDSGENERQNYPVLVTSPGSILVDVSLDSEPNTVYQIDTYLNDSCHSSGFGEGQEYRLTFPQQTDSQGHLHFQFSIVGVTGRYLTATATDPDGNTSEFSACALLEDAPPPTPTATNTATSTPTNTATSTATPSPTPSATNTPTATATIGPSPTPTATFTASPSPTATSSPTVGPSPTPTATLTATPDPTQGDTFFIYLPIITR